MDARWKQESLRNFWGDIAVIKDVTTMSKAEKIARILYGAIVRYVKAKKSPASMGKSHFRLDSCRVWRGNVERKIDTLEKQR